MSLGGDKCELCGDHGGYLYLLTLKRLCFLCQTEDKQVLPLTPARVLYRYNLPEDAVNIIPSALSLPGIYGSEKRFPKEHRPRQLLDPVSAHTIARIFLGPDIVDVEGPPRNTMQFAMQTLDDPDGTHPDEWDYNGGSNNPLRFMAVVRMPAMDKLTGRSMQTGFCNACLRLGDNEDRRYSWRREYTRITFAEHVKECGWLEQDPTTKFWSHRKLDTDAEPP
ncbi:hypothetical protein BDZ85DRAFT_278775 [Elsinoe ampelina]|uniref:Uncharacterized protein n=1 Tax=Elsinoe ampelina TaxID=302913 RepID=A0A6A6GML4_9PEZI|nr:hypothetical protein BDZ85DRAFT_278775 [Elsinoe ampelina]